MNYVILIPLIALGAAAVLASRKLRHVFTVQEGYAGLLFQHGKLAGTLPAGRHVRWGRGFTLSCEDLRKASLEVTGQEVLTGDHVGLKASVIVQYEIADPVKAQQATQSWQVDLYHAAQLALRSVAGSLPAETFLGQRAGLGPQLLARVQPEVEKLGLTVHSVALKDLMFPAELKRAFAEVLKAKQEGHAALERARGESAALRNLANAARVLEGNPALQNLRLMQTLTAAQNAGNTLVLGMPAGFVPLQNGRAAATPEAGAGEA